VYDINIYTNCIDTQRDGFDKKTQQCLFDILYNFCRKHFSLQEEMSKILSQMYLYIALHVKYSLLFSDFNET